MIKYEKTHHNKQKIITKGAYKQNKMKSTNSSDKEEPICFYFFRTTVLLLVLLVKALTTLPPIEGRPSKKQILGKSLIYKSIRLINNNRIIPLE